MTPCWKGAPNLMKIVFHIDDPIKAPQLKANIENALNILPEVQLTVVAIGDGTEIYSQERFQQFMQTHAMVEFEACRNSLRTRQIEEQSIKPATVVPAGSLRLAELQQNGYSYIKL